MKKKSKRFNEILKKSKDEWKIKLIDTGENTLTGGRIKKVLKYVKNGSTC